MKEKQSNLKQEINDTMETSFYNNNVTKSKKQTVIVGGSARS